MWHFANCSLTRIRTQNLEVAAGTITQNLLLLYGKTHDDCSKPYMFNKENGHGPSEAYFFIGKQTAQRHMFFDHHRTLFVDRDRTIPE